MNPAFLDNMSWEMAEVYGALQDQILINLAHHFPYFNAANLPRSSFAYQADMLAQMGQVNRETMRIIRSFLSDADGALQGVLEAAIMDSLKSVNPSLYDAARRGIFRMPTQPIVSPNQMQAFQRYYQQSATKLNLVNTVMLESTQSAYQQAVSGIVSEMELSERMNRLQIAMDTAAGETITGVSSWNTALKHATDRMKENGITGFIDHAGHHWSAEAYAAMDIRTTVANTARAAVWEQNERFGNDLYLVSSHNGARPLCYPWQNKVISSLNRSGVTYDLDGNEIQIYPQNATSYGEPAGLFGINCRHTADPFIPGVSVADGTPQDETANEKTYEESQQQRALERKIREEKRDLLMMKAQGASAEEIKAQREKIRKTDDDIDAFCEQTGRTRRQNREAVYTKREFPSKDSYDVTQFEREQKEQIEKYYKDGGAQQDRTFGVMTPNEPITPATPPVTPTPSTPVVNNVAQQATQTQGETDTIERKQIDANNFPDSFNKKKSKAFADAVNATEGTDPDVVELFNTLGAQVNNAGVPVTVSYTEENHAIGEYTTYGGKRVKITAKVPKLTNAEYLTQEVGTTAHELGHLFDHLNSATGTLSSTFNNGELSNALQNARPMSERVRTLITDAVAKGNAAEKLVMDAAKAEVDAINGEISKALKEHRYSDYNALNKKRNSIWKNAARLASNESRKAHNGVNAIEDIYDAISGGTLRDTTSGMYGHGSRYYGHNPGGTRAATETVANYCTLALAYPDLFTVMAEEQPEIWNACGNIVRAMIGR